MHKVIDPAYFRMNLVQLILWLGIGALVGLVALWLTMPAGESVSWFPVIPVFFGILGYVFVRILRACDPYRQKNLVNVYLLLRVIKMLCTLALVLVYGLFLDVPLHFSLTAVAVFYILHLIWETRFFFSYEKQLKEIRKNENTD